MQAKFGEINMWKDILKINTKDAISDAERFAPNEVAEGKDITGYLERNLHRIKEKFHNWQSFVDAKDYVKLLDSNLKRRSFYNGFFIPLTFKPDEDNMIVYRRLVNADEPNIYELRDIKDELVEEQIENLADAKRVIADYLSEKEKALKVWNKYSGEYF